MRWYWHFTWWYCLKSCIRFPHDREHMITECSEQHLFPPKHPYLEETTTTQICLCSISLCLATCPENYLHTNSFIMQWYSCALTTTQTNTPPGFTVPSLLFCDSCLYMHSWMSEITSPWHSTCYCCIVCAPRWLSLFFTNPAAGDHVWVHVLFLTAALL